MVKISGLWQMAQKYLWPRPAATNELLQSAELTLNKAGFVYINSNALQVSYQTTESLNAPHMVGEPHANYVRRDEGDRSKMHFVSIIMRDGSKQRQPENFDIIYTTQNARESSSLSVPIGVVSLLDFVQSSLPTLQILSESAVFERLKLNANTAVLDAADQPAIPSGARYRPGITKLDSLQS